MIFRKIGCLVVTSNSVKLKSISSWPNFRAKTTKNHFRFHFHFKWLPALENRRERERERERQREREREREREKERRDRDIIGTAPSADIIGITDGAVPTSPTPRTCRSRQLRLRRSRSRRSRSRWLRSCLRLSEFDDFFLGFVCILRNEWYYIFIWWPRKCEKMCFLWYFQEHKQTSENIFRNIFWNATKHMKTFSFPENSIFGKYLFSGNTFTRTKRRLSRIVFLIH